MIFIRKYLFIFILFSFLCNLGLDASEVSLMSKNYLSQIQKIKKFARVNSYNQKIAFMIDYNVHSGKQRFFVLDLKKDSIIHKGLVCYGDCKGKNKKSIPKHFSNKSGSNCTSLGMAVMGERAYSSWGKNFKYWIDGLEKSNNNMRKRVVVLHAWNKLPDKDVYPRKIATSWGCPTVSLKFMDQLDLILKKEKKVLLYSF